MMIHLLKTMILNAFLKNYQTKQILLVGPAACSAACRLWIRRECNEHKGYQNTY